MFHLKIKPILLSIVLLLFISLLTSSSLLLRYLPENKVSISLFKAVYSSPISKKALLEFYSPVRGNQGGDIPKEINQFLIQKIENTNDEKELSAIVHFYIRQAGGHRIGYLIQISEESKIKVADQLIKALEDESNLGGKLMMLEEIRTGQHLGKGSFKVEGINHPKFSTIENYEKWFDEKAAPIAGPKYREWWNLNLSWEEKKKINPLQGTNIGVSECCG